MCLLIGQITKVVKPSKQYSTSILKRLPIYLSKVSLTWRHLLSYVKTFSKVNDDNAIQTLFLTIVIL